MNSRSKVLDSLPTLFDFGHPDFEWQQGVFPEESGSYLAIGVAGNYISGPVYRMQVFEFKKTRGWNSDVYAWRPLSPVERKLCEDCRMIEDDD